MENQETQPTLSRKQIWYQTRKDDPEFIRKRKEAKKRYYNAHREKVIQESLARYYKMKEQQVAA